MRHVVLVIVMALLVSHTKLAVTNVMVLQEQELAEQKWQQSRTR
jgi:hypothetical protein